MGPVERRIPSGSFFALFKTVYSHSPLILTLALKTLQTRFAGTAGGALWAVMQPVATVLVFWFVFSVGFKVRPLGDVPFIVVFLCGFIPWAMFSETLLTSTSAVTGNAHLIKKTVFPVEILPVVNLVAALIIHLSMVLILLLVLVLNRVAITMGVLQFFYYFVGMTLFSLGLSWCFSAVNVFYRDLGSVIGAFLNLWFWLTPVAWMIETMPERWHFLLKLNPMYYIIRGYRASFIDGAKFWNDGLQGLYFWTICLITLAAGTFIFGKLKPEFADVL